MNRPKAIYPDRKLRMNMMFSAVNREWLKILVVVEENDQPFCLAPGHSMWTVCLYVPLNSSWIEDAIASKFIAATRSLPCSLDPGI